MRCCEDADANDREKMLKDDYIFEDKKIVIRHHGIRVIRVFKYKQRTLALNMEEKITL